MIKGQIARIERDAEVAHLLEVLTERIAPTDLQSLLLEVYARLAAATTAKRLLEQYEANRFVAHRRPTRDCSLKSIASRGASCRRATFPWSWRRSARLG